MGDVFLLLLVYQGGGGIVGLFASSWRVRVGGVLGGGGGWMVMCLSFSMGGCCGVYLCVRCMVSRVA